MMNIGKLMTGTGVLTTLLMTLSGQAQPFTNEYELIDYTGRASENAISALVGKLENGAISLSYEGNRGYFDALLDALDIDPSSQVLVFSGTSLQNEHISPATPRSIYFNEDTYVAWVQNSDIVEMAATDNEKGLVFYLFHNERDESERFERTNQSCLVCHDSAGTMGGGVPELMVLSGIYSRSGNPLAQAAGGHNTTDSTPLIERWGGWYVTGRHEGQPHLGNVLLPGKDALGRVDQFRHGNIDTLEGLDRVDTDPYLRSTSDIVALLVLEHQMTVQNRLTYLRFKVPAVLQRIGEEEALDAPDWSSLPQFAQRALTRMHEELVRRLLFVDAAPYKAPVSGNEDYQSWFESRGLRDAQGRSLRQLNLETRLLEYPLSYLIYSEAFNTLPGFSKDYVYQRLAEVLEGRDDSDAFSHLTGEQRQVILSILLDTRPEIEAYLAGRQDS